MTVTDGFVPTPPAVADFMAKELFVEAPTAADRVLFPGAGTGCLAAAVKRYCAVRDHPCPDAVAIDTNPDRLAVLEEHVAATTPEVPPLSSRSIRRLQVTYPKCKGSADRAVAMDVETRVGDFLLEPPRGEFDYILANPPYTRYLAINEAKRERYRDEFRSAEGQFALYWPFVEQMQRLLADDGHLVFIAPTGYLTTRAASAFRDELRRDRLDLFMMLPARVFGDVKVGPVVTALRRDPSLGRDGHFWLESFVYKPAVDELLRDVGVRDPERRGRLVDEYYESYKATKRLLDSRQKLDGQDGGYDVKSIPAEMRPDNERQADLGEWS